MHSGKKTNRVVDQPACFYVLVSLLKEFLRLIQKSTLRVNYVLDEQHILVIMTNSVEKLSITYIISFVYVSNSVQRIIGFYIML